METIHAYNITLLKIAELKKAGIRVKRRPSVLQHDPETMAKYSGPEHLPPNKWVIIKLYFETDAQAKLIADKALHLTQLGIQFDYSGCHNEREWALDWSFQYRPEDKPDWREGISQVEDEISAINKRPTYSLN